MDYSPPDFSVNGISQARIPEWVAISFSRGFYQPRDPNFVSCIGRQILYTWATWEAQESTIFQLKKKKWIAFVHTAIFPKNFFFLINNASVKNRKILKKNHSMDKGHFEASVCSISFALPHSLPLTDHHPRSLYHCSWLLATYPRHVSFLSFIQNILCSVSKDSMHKCFTNCKSL